MISIMLGLKWGIGRAFVYSLDSADVRFAVMVVTGHLLRQC